VKSRYISPGYWRDPDKTKSAFLSDPSGSVKRIYLTGDLGMRLRDGCLIHIGRRDFQAKIRGFRVDVSEIEVALREIDGVDDAVVVTRETHSGEKTLVAYFVPNTRPPITVTQIRQKLTLLLADYMIPSAFISLDAIPKTPNGKTDRLNLPPPSRERPELDTSFASPDTFTRKKLAQIWAEVLDLHAVGINDNFFDLGGNSLLASRVIDRIIRKFGTELPLRSLFEAPTIAQLAGILAPEKWAESQVSLWSTYPSSVVPFQPNGSNPPLFWFNWGPWDFRLPRCLGRDQPVYGLQHQSQDGRRARHTSIEKMAAHYINEIRAVRPKGPYFLGGLCIGGMVAFEMAQQLQKQAEPVPLLVLLDPNNSRSSKLSSVTKDVPSVLSYIIRLRNKVHRHLRALAPLGSQEKLSYALVRVHNRVIGFRAKISWRARRFLCEAFGVPLPPSLRTHYIANIYGRASRAYVPQPYRGRVILFKTQGRYRSGQSGWERLVPGKLEIEELDTDHDNIFKEPYVQTFAEKLNLHLGKAQKNLTHTRIPTVDSPVQ
jgi:thioesterase domain-containing protein